MVDALTFQPTPSIYAVWPKMYVVWRDHDGRPQPFC